jgi:hypothetical protein
LYKKANVLKGFAGEQAVRSALNGLGYRVKSHTTSDDGLDIEAMFNGHAKVCAEVLCWYGGYIHPNRFSSLIRNLAIGKYDERILICFGVKPTLEQHRLLNGYNIKLLCLPRIENISVKDVITLLSNMLSCYSVVCQNRVVKMPIYVEWTVNEVPNAAGYALLFTFYCKVKGLSAC